MIKNMNSSKDDFEKYCSGCDKAVTQIKKRYRGKEYCSTCYSRIFKKRICPSCHEYARLPKNDDQAICNECIKKLPCIRCNQKGKPIGKLTEYGAVCNSCSVYFRQIEPCERCNTPSQILTRISRFNDNLRVCPKCATRDYETCLSCRKYRLLEIDEHGGKKCKKCKTDEKKSCLNCSTMIAAGCGGLCDECYWSKNLNSKLERNKILFGNQFLKDKYVEYIEWLNQSISANKAALYINKHTDFFVKTESLWINSVPTYLSFLQLLRANGLRKFELVMRWLNESHLISAESKLMNLCSEIDQLDTLINHFEGSEFGRKIINAYKDKMLYRVQSDKISMRSVRLAVKPAVSLLQYAFSVGKDLPDIEEVKSYLTECSGQAAALTGFINFLNEQYGTDIDYLTLKKSCFIKKSRKKKLEQDLLAMLSSDHEIEVLVWVTKGLQLFHNMSYRGALAIKADMIVNVQDGYEINYNNKKYWLPKNIVLLSEKNK